MRLGCFLVIATIALFVFGFQAVRDAAAFQKPKVVQFDEFLKSPAKEGWFQVKGCILELPSASYKMRKRSRSITEAYIPVYSPAQMQRRATDEGAAKEKAALILATEDEAVLDTLRELREIDSAGEAKIDEFVEKNHERLWIQKDLEGMIRAGVNASEETRSELAGLNDSLRPDFVIMQDGWKPNMGMGLAMLGGGVVALLITVVFFLGMFRKEE